MSKLSKIKAELAKLLVQFKQIKTDNGILEYDESKGELSIDTIVNKITETGDVVAVEDGEYNTEDGVKITVKDGIVVAIETPIAEIVDEVTEDAVEAAEEVAETETIVDEEPKEEVTEDKPTVDETNEEVIKLEDINDEIANIHKEINELYKLVDSILKKVGETRDEADERLKKLECKSLAKPAAEEFEAITNTSKTNYKNTDKLIDALKSLRK